jgi:predicted phage terminase large subunit-like protein
VNVAELRRRLWAVSAEQAERSLFRFLRDFAWPVLQPGTPFSDNWHIHSICEHLEAVSSGEIKRLLINLPFRMLKSTIVSQTFPAWEWTRKPHIQYLTSSYAKEVATRDAVDSRRIIESEMYRRAWGEKFKMTSDQNVKSRYENNKKGSRVVTSTDAAGTGFGGNRIIVDDPVSAQEADSEVARAASIEWWRGTASSRLNNPREDAIVVVHQRLHQEDLTGYILANETGWEHLVLPMRYCAELRKTTSLGFFDPRKTEGELMSPERLPEEVVLEIEKRMGAYHVQAQLQQNPGSREGSIFKVKDWKYYHVHPTQIARDMEEIVWSWDCTFKDGTGTDFVAGHCIGRKGANKYLLHRVCERMGFGATKSRILNEYERASFRPKTIAVLIEDKANGPAVLDALENDVPGLTPITPQGGKVARANAVQPQHEAGNFFRFCRSIRQIPRC